MKTLLKLFATAFLVVNCHMLYATSITVQDSILVNTTWSADTVRVISDIFIRSNAELTIVPGTRVEFQGAFGIIVHGRLLAVGAKNDTIEFTVNDTTGYSQNNHTGWKGIDFLTLTADDTSKLAYCKLKYGKGVSQVPYSGSAISVASDAKVIVSNCLLMHNYAPVGGAVYMTGDVLLKNNKIIFNKAGHGGGIFIQGCSPLILNNLISNNNAEQNGGGIYFDYASSSDSIFFVNNTICNNNASSGGGFYFDGSGPTVLVNNIIWNNNSETNKEQLYLRTHYIKPEFYNNNIEGGKAGFAGEVYPVIVYKDNINIDPSFTNANQYQLSDSSFCINTGKSNFSALELVNSDLSDNPRIYDGIVDEIDIGAYEYQSDPANRRPLLVKSGNQNTLISTSKHMTVDYFDADIGDTHMITVSSDNINITVNNLSGDTAGSTYDLIPVDEWSGTALITVKITDNQGCYDSETYELMVSDSVSGFIKENTCWSQDTIIVKGDIYVDDGVTLTVDPGTVVLFCGNYKIDVYGKLLAVGTSENNIAFTVSDTAGYHNNCFTGWQGIKFMYTQPDNDTSKLIHCIIQFIKNESAYGSIAISHFSKILISKCHIKNNLSLSSALIEISRAQPAITENFITENRFTGGGHLLDINFCNPRLKNNIICNNDCPSGVINLETSNVEIINNTICYNKAHTIILGISSDPLFINTIFWGNYSDNRIGLYIFYKTTCHPVFESCVIPEELYSDRYPMNNIIFLNPYFSDTLSMDYSLTDSSYCINTGTSDTIGLNIPISDIAGNPRIIGDIIDIGAYEYTFNFPPTNIMLSNDHIEENVPSGSVVGILSTMDSNNTDAHTYAFDTGDGINDIDNNCFIIALDTLKINLAPDYEIKDTFRIYVKTTDNGINTLSYSKAFVLIIEDVNEQPVIEPQSFNVNENSQEGTIIGTITAIDVDKGQTLTYSIISGNTNNAFAIDPFTGKITVNNADVLDYETTPSFGLIIIVQDNGPGDLENEALITININNINEPVSLIDFDSDILRIYPNPAKGSVYLEFLNKNNGELLIELRSINGTIYHQSVTKVSNTDRIIEFELPDFPEGIYILNIKSDTILITRKFSIMRVR